MFLNQSMVTLNSVICSMKLLNNSPILFISLFLFTTKFIEFKLKVSHVSQLSFE